MKLNPISQLESGAFLLIPIRYYKDSYWPCNGRISEKRSGIDIYSPSLISIGFNGFHVVTRYLRFEDITFYKHYH